MVDASLLGYFKTQVARGHSVQEVRQFLIERGYNQSVVDECASEVYGNHGVNPNFSPNNISNQVQRDSASPSGINAKPVHKKSLGYLVISIILISIIVAIAMILFTNQTVQVEQDNIQIEISGVINKEFEYGSNIELQRNIATNSDKGLPTKVFYEILDSNSNSILKQDETIYLNKLDEKSLIFKPKELEGDYLVKVTARYKDVTTVKNFYFSVKEKDNNQIPQLNTTKTESCSDGIENQDEEGVDCGGSCSNQCFKQCPIFYDDQDSCTKDYCNKNTNFEPVHEPIVPCCGNSICETGEKGTCESDCTQDSSETYFEKDDIRPIFEIEQSEITIVDQIEQIKIISRKELVEALELCELIVMDFYQDECFYQISTEHNNENLCDNILDERKVDQCYTQVSKSKEDYTLCAEIDDSLSRDSCYMRFGLKGNYNVCPFLQDKYYKDTCSQLRDLSELSPESAKEYQERVE